MARDTAGTSNASLPEHLGSGFLHRLTSLLSTYAEDEWLRHTNLAKSEWRISAGFRAVLADGYSAWGQFFGLWVTDRWMRKGGYPCPRWRPVGLPGAGLAALTPLLDIAEASQRVRLGTKVASTNMDWSDAPRLAAIVESSDDAIIAKDLNGVILSWNRAAERLFGYTASEVFGKPMTIIFPPDRLEEEAAILNQIGRGERVDHYETARCQKDGQIINVAVTISPIRDASGKVTGASTILRDLTGRNVRDQRILELQAELAHVQRLNELGQVVSTLVHEVNQPLTAISNYVNACRRLIKTGDQERIQSALQRITDQNNRTRGIVERIRDFVKKRDVQMRAEKLSQVIEEAIALTRASVRDGGLRLTVETDPPGVQVEIDKIQVQQVLFNLLRNAIEAMQDQPNRELVIATSLVQGGMVEISVADTGPGLVDEVRAKLFQPFVTTKVHGMGVGLSVCRAIVESHGGRLWADDNPSRGTVFRFTVRHAGPDRL